MNRLDVIAALVIGAAAAPLLGRLPWFARGNLTERLAPYRPVGTTGPRLRTRGTGWREVLAGPAAELGARAASLLGVHDDLARRLDRVGRPTDTAAFRLRQLGGAALVGLAVPVLGGLAGAAAVPVLLLAVAAAVLAFLWPEHRLSNEIEQRRALIEAELPVVAEQLGMLLSAGYSLSGAIARIAARGSGCCAEDLTRVGRRIRHGLSDTAALGEWAELVDLDHVTRLVNVLRLNREAGDLGRLISEEARAIRRALHRRLIEDIERRGQQVWIPVTVATLVPGVIFMAVPFLDAVRGLTG